MSNTYTCSSCGQAFDKGWSDEEAAAELGGAFPGYDVAECDLVCDGCYQDIALRVALFRGFTELTCAAVAAKWADDTLGMLVKSAVVKMIGMTPRELAAAVEASEPGTVGHA